MPCRFSIQLWPGLEFSHSTRENIPCIKSNTWPQLCFLWICQENFLSWQQIWKSTIRFGIASGWRRPTSSQPTPAGHNKQKTVGLIFNPSAGRTNQFLQFFQSYSWRLFHVEYSRAWLRAWHHRQNAVQFKGSHVFASLEVGLHQCLGKDDLFYSHDSKVCKGSERLPNLWLSWILYSPNLPNDCAVVHHPIFRKGCTN